jgi:hypothetical protein
MTPNTARDGNRVRSSIRQDTERISPYVHWVNFTCLNMIIEVGVVYQEELLLRPVHRNHYPHSDLGRDRGEWPETAHAVEKDFVALRQVL